MKNFLLNLWKGSKRHTLSIVFTLPFTLIANVYNFMYLRDAVFNFNDTVISQYFLQLFICGFIAYWVAYVIEMKQIKKGVNDTEPFWKKYARPDIWVATVCGVIGGILGILIYNNI